MGSSKQFVLKYAPEDYPEFSIRNLHVNGVIWDVYLTTKKAQNNDGIWRQTN